MNDDRGAESWREYNHIELSVRPDAPQVLDRLRAQCPVGRSEKFGGFYILTRYADCVAAATDPRFSSSLQHGPGAGFPHTKARDGTLQIPMINDDGQRHRDFRLPLQKLFSPKFAASQGDRIREICDGLIDRFIEQGRADLADQYSIELPAILICELLDLPADRRREFQGWASDLVANASNDAMQKLVQLTEDLYRLRTESPGQDIPSKILEFSIEGHPITKDEWRGLVLLLILGGLDTTANAGSHIFEMIGQSPELRAFLLEDRSRIATVIKEFVRVISPVSQHSRGVTEDVEVGGHQFHKGDVVLLNWLAANHDPAVFEDPHTFNADRAADRHLGFGHGPHRCLGSYLALVELQVMIEQILDRLPDFELVPGGVTRFPSLNRGISHLQVTFTPGKRRDHGVEEVRDANG
ncbi:MULTISPECIES: cytochrome P450 [unclassified Caballeronia]|uniref:cytochrome P450 n=1 Tax=unclassified Caballeronia TaxID=2646786 RepID=UPI0028653BFC|nr:MULTISPECIES: cytochrome P450 [unclassified Caballeronia]MDR5777307.1 cytochrome P450 [Caballeronia sp. LZ002]MDR5852761.1 cytochrome P450 [Caballeronia sp. LZ003]